MTNRRIEPRVFLPSALIIILLGAAALVGLVAPSRVTDGVYQVHVDGIAITTESLACGRAGDTANCVVPVGGRDLEITVVYPDPNPLVQGRCTAAHGGRPVSCTSLIGDFGHASQSVFIEDGLGLTEAERARWRDAAPWWRSSDGPLVAGAVLLGLLTLAAACATRLLGGGGGVGGWRPVAAIGTGLLGLLLFGVVGVVVSAFSPWTLMLAPPSLVAAMALGVWQWQVSGPGGDRWGHVVLAAATTALYTAVAVFVILLQSGFVD